MDEGGHRPVAPLSVAGLEIGPELLQSLGGVAERSGRRCWQRLAVVPDEDGGVGRAADQVAAVLREAERADVAAVPFELADLLGGEGVPEHNRRGAQVAGHGPAIRGDGETWPAQVARVAVELADELAG